MNTAIKRLIDRQQLEIAEIKGRMNALTRDLELAQLKLEAFEQAGAAVDGNASDLFQEKLTDKAGRKRRPLSDTWRTVLTKMIATGGAGASITDIVGYADVERKIARSQMRYYVKQRFVRRHGDRFVVTEAGIGACKSQ